LDELDRVTCALLQVVLETRQQVEIIGEEDRREAELQRRFRAGAADAAAAVLSHSREPPRELRGQCGSGRRASCSRSAGTWTGKFGATRRRRSEPPVDSPGNITKRSRDGVIAEVNVRVTAPSSTARDPAARRPAGPRRGQPSSVVDVHVASASARPHSRRGHVARVHPLEVTRLALEFAEQQDDAETPARGMSTPGNAASPRDRSTIGSVFLPELWHLSGAPAVRKSSGGGVLRARIPGAGRRQFFRARANPLAG